MTDVFISYKRRWRSQVEDIAQALRELGVDVWFDADLEPGSSFSGEISREIRAARSVLACLSNDAFPHGGDENGWVLGEATIGRDRKVLVAVLLEPTDLDPPWNTVHLEDLTGFSPKTLSGDRSHWQNVLGAIGRHLDRPGLAEFDRANATGTAQALKDWAQQYPVDRLVPFALRRIEALEHPDRAVAFREEKAGAPIQSAQSSHAEVGSRQPPRIARRHGPDGVRSADATPPDVAGSKDRGGRRAVPILLSLVVVFTAAGLLTWQLGLIHFPSGPRADVPALTLTEEPARPDAGAATADIVGASIQPDLNDGLASTSTGNSATEAMTPTTTDSAQGRIIDLRFEVVALAMPQAGDLQGAVEQLHEVAAN